MSNWTFTTHLPTTLIDTLDHISDTTNHTRKGVLIIAAQEFRKQYPITNNDLDTLPQDNTNRGNRTKIHFHCNDQDYNLLRYLGRGNDQIKHQHHAYLKIQEIIPTINYTTTPPINRKNRQAYTPEEDQIIRENWQTLTSRQLQQLLPHRSPQGIQARAHRLKLDSGSRHGCGIKGSDSHTLWTIADEKRLLNLARTNPNRQHLAHELGRTPESIKWKLKTLRSQTCQH